MSGIYIPNFEPSKEGYISCIYPDGTVVKPKNEEPFYEIYKAIPVPNHGDLIDRDALGTPGTIEEDTLWRGRIETEVYLASTIYNAATIIPADKEGEG